MGDLKISGNLVEEQSWPKRPTLIKPIPIRAQAKVPIGASSSFQPWKKYPSLHKLAPIPENDIHLIEENTTNEGGATLGDANDHNTVNEAQANMEKEILEKKRRRTMSNRCSAQRSRLKKIAYTEELKNRIKYFEDQGSLLNQQLGSHKNEWRLLKIEHHELKFEMAALERKRILQEVEIEKNRAEVQRLRELERKSAAEAKAKRILNLTSLQIMSNSNFNPSALAGFDRKN